jgi:hypothetical protein
MAPVTSLTSGTAGMLRLAKKAYTTRFVAEALEQRPRDFTLTDDLTVAPAPGDVLLARVLQIGQHKRLELTTSRKAAIMPGDLIMVAYGNRYAVDQFLGEVPADLGLCHLVAAGGMASRAVFRHDAMAEATIIEPLGLVHDRASGKDVNLIDYAPLPLGVSLEGATRPPRVLAVMGTSMNSGKSTTLALLARGLSNAGYVVHAGKVTGTGAGNDVGLFRDAGAQRVVDHTDFGYGSTFRTDHEELIDLTRSMCAHLADADAIEDEPDVVLVEIADGLYQQENKRLLADPRFVEVFDGAVFASGDALGATEGSRLLAAAGLPVFAVSGVFTSSPLALDEVAEACLAEPVMTMDLPMPETALRVARLEAPGEPLFVPSVSQIELPVPEAVGIGAASLR